MKKIIIVLAILTGLALLAACGTEKEFKKLPFEVIVSTDGAGQVAAVPAGQTPVFEDGTDGETIHITLPDTADYVLEAKPDEGWVFAGWQKDGRPYSTESRLNVTLSSVAVYTAVFETDNSTLRIMTQPLAETEVTVPDGFELYVGVNNDELVQSYQWQVNNGDPGDPAWVDLDECVTGRTNSLVKPATYSDERDNEYRCVIKNGKITVNSNAATLTIKSGPAITTQPADTSVSAGASSKPSRARASMPRRRCSSRTPAPRSLCCALRSSRWHNADAGVTEGRVSLSVENEERLPDVADAVAVEWATCGTVGDVADVVQIVGASAAVAFGVAAGAQL